MLSSESESSVQGKEGETLFGGVASFSIPAGAPSSRFWGGDAKFFPSQRKAEDTPV